MTQTTYSPPTLARFGTFRQLTQTGKSIVGDDLVPGVGLDCQPNAPPPHGCVRS